MKNILTLLVLIIFTSCALKKQTKSIAHKLVPERVQLTDGYLERIDFFPSKFIESRGVDVWLPEDYSASKEYRVLYMNDGQRLFTGEADKLGRELMADEIASRLIREDLIDNVIIVGVYSIGSVRHRNYFPEKPFDSLPKKFTDSLKKMGNAMNMRVDINSGQYLKFIVEELKPYIDNTYATLNGYKNNFMGGASMGGLISMYAVCEYPEVFGGAISMSTHWPGFFPSKVNPIPGSFFDYMRMNLPPSETHRFYFDFGTMGMDRFYGQYEEAVNQVFEERGYDADNFNNIRVEGGNHSEEFWSKRFHIPLLFLFEKN